MRVLVTGANGFTGSYVVKNLINRGYNVVGLVRKNSNLNSLQKMPIELIYADLANDSLEGKLEGIENIYHVAAAFRVANMPHKYFYDVNLEGTKKLLKEAKRVGVKKFVHVSTVGVQGDIKNPPAHEEDPYNPLDHYQKSKVEAEKYVLEFSQREGVAATIVRPTGIYGPGDERF